MEKTIEKHITDYGVTEFIAGNYGGFDNTYYSEGMEKVPRKFAIVRANRYAVDHVDYLIAYAWYPASNARNLAEYAQQRERHVMITVTVLHEE